MTQRGCCQRVVHLGVALVVELVIPARLVVAARVLVVAGEQPVLEAEAVLHDQAGIGIGAHVLVLDFVLLQQIADHAVQERDIGARTDRCVDIRNRRGAGKARIDHHQLGVVLDLRFDHPLETAWMRLGGIAAHDHHHIGILDVLPSVGHCTATECWGQTGHRRSVSDTRLIVEDQHPEGAGDLPSEVGRLVRRRGGRQHAGAEPAVDRGAGGVLGDEVRVAILLHQRRDAVQRKIPGDLLELATARRAVLREPEPVGACTISSSADPFGHSVPRFTG